MQRLLILLALAGCAAFNCGCSSDPASSGLVGAYRDQTTSNPEVVGAAQFAVTTQSGVAGTEIALVRIASAETQVVAGVNYRMLLSVRINGKEESAQAIVWQKLNGEYQLITWKWQPKEL